MKTFFTLSIVVFLCLDLIQAEDKVDKLKIGIKKRVENCDKKAKNGDMLHIHYTGTLLDGTVFDSSRERDPLTFTLGSGQVIQGWDKGILGMCVGEARKLQIPPELGYGSRAMGKIPANSVLIFEVDLIKIARKEEF